MDSLNNLAEGLSDTLTNTKNQSIKISKSQLAFEIVEMETISKITVFAKDEISMPTSSAKITTIPEIKTTPNTLVSFQASLPVMGGKASSIVYFYFFRKPNLFKSKETHNNSITVGSNMLSVKVYNCAFTNLSQPVVLNFRKTAVVNHVDTNDIKCSFWNVERGK